MRIETLISSPYGENTYILDIGKGKAVVIDPGADGRLITSKIADMKLKPEFVFLTHGHYDHILGLGAFDPAIVWAHESERSALENHEINLSCFLGTPLAIKGINYYGDNFHRIENFEFTHVPGHTAGCVLIGFEKSLFTGDTLFFDTVGRTDVPTGSSQKLKKSLEVFNSMSEDIICYPGHGDSFTLKTAREVNYFLKK